MLEAASPGVAERYSRENEENESSSSEAEFLTPLQSPIKGEASDADAETSKASLLARRHSSYRSALKSTVLSPGDPSAEAGTPGAFQLKKLEVARPEAVEDENDDPSTPLPRNNEQFVSPKSLSMSPNVKALERPSEKDSGDTTKKKTKGRRKQLMEHTANLWHILDDVCEHSTLGEAELLGTNERIAKLKSMNEELGELESEMEALHSIYAFESKS